MNFKTIVIIILAVLITVIFMQNTDEVVFTLLWKQIYISKLWMMLTVTLFGFIIGVIVARPKKKKEIETTAYQNAKDVPLEVNNISKEDNDYISMKKTNQLSDEDRDYLQ
ncbi:hypothetical protein [Pedobacter cryophilus]|jgi:uncharacterized integral membrane protein|uniref:Lipopolysaccharide assembly protein A domain-containing protein n=1 Tax=Pedobacter cryophilus TaxID=2571271 RepID=A0A4U1BTL8_9SPHI|nr:hypothetical protein [Pedobacter cryophilus]TKB95261.1 hypothetical protein FA046_16795 [Pedobacter cryophilus]